MPLRLDLGAVGDDEAQLAEGSQDAFAGAVLRTWCFRNYRRLAVIDPKAIGKLHPWE
jgi:hypothetical protein